MTTPANYPPAPTPKKNWFARHKILTGLLIVVIAAIIGTATNSGSKTTQNAASPATQIPGATQVLGATQEPESAAAPAEAPSGIGTAVRDGKFEFVVNGVDPGVPTVGSDFSLETAQGEFVLVRMTVRNIGDEAQSFATSAQKLLDASNKQYSSDDIATITLDPNVAYEQINPGNSLDATVVFDVPKGTVPAQIELHDSIFSGGVTTSLG